MMVTMELLTFLCALANEAGQAVMDVYRSDFTSVEKCDHSPLTQADLRADAIIRAGLEAAFPDIFILSEESSSQKAAGDSMCFLVDPLDGTREFIKRNGEFTVNIALIRDGVPVAGVVFAPALDLMFFGGEGVGAWRQCEQGVVSLRVAIWDPVNPLRIIGSRSHFCNKTENWLKKLPYKHNLFSAGSSLKFCRIAEGAMDLYPRLAPTSQWDTAAAQCILELAGGSVVSLQGTRLRYGLDQPLSAPAFIARGGNKISFHDSQAGCDLAPNI